jgi:hypothetical protein
LAAVARRVDENLTFSFVVVVGIGAIVKRHVKRGGHQL